MKQVAYYLFDTPIGSCGIAWSEDPDASGAPAVAFFQLPEATLKETERRIARNAGANRATAPPASIARMIERIIRHLHGEPQDFSDINLDLEECGPFARQVYQAARKIPAGKTRTYGELAKVVRNPGAARAVGQALGKNPIPLIIPCHRILAAGGKPGGFSAHGGCATKAKMLEIEGATMGKYRRA